MQELNVSWKKIGHYNMKCRWVREIPGGHEVGVNDSMHSNRYFGDENSIIENNGILDPPNLVKFEIQVLP